MRKKTLLFGILVAVILIALCICLGLFLLRQDDGRETNRTETTGEQIGISTAEEKTTKAANVLETTTEKKENPYTFLNLGKIYYLPLDTTAFKNQVAAFMENNHLTATTVLALGKVEDNKEDPDGTANFYLQLDDAAGTILQAVYDKQTAVFTLSVSESIPDVEQYGGVATTEANENISGTEPEYSSEGTEIINFGDANITDVEQTLSRVADMATLQHDLGIFLRENGEERRNLFVSSVEKTETGYKTVLEFETARIDRKKVQVLFENGKYHFSLVE
ncbi:hypothetical protein B5E53_10385 [Eubacterium sp. An11]|uniref:hypothetical protein n=1 Tax=Eubacterium sp. An11 TaxID=1965542 RepID=UPI000B3805A7|nr:hypothetical protein [Eubacterium sp. An11]OUQ66434.1 hypothetical protein B5E53_10385 [Eubacterium sp. An11]